MEIFGREKEKEKRAKIYGSFWKQLQTIVVGWYVILVAVAVSSSAIVDDGYANVVL